MKRLNNLNLPVKLAISATILVLLFMKMDKGDILSDMEDHFQASAWMWSAVFMLLQIILLSFRWEMLVNIGKKHMSFMDALKINVASQLANVFFIATVGGILVRIGMSVQLGATIFKSLIATAFDRLMTLGALILLSAAFMPSLAHYVDNATFTTFSMYVSVLVFTMFIFAPIFINTVLFRMPAVAKLKGRLRYGLRYLKVLLKNPFLCGKILIVSITAQMAFFVAEYFIAHSTGASLSFWQLMTVLPIIALLSALPISVGGWGVREGAFVYFLGLLGVPMETAFLISVQIGLIGMLITAITGIPYILTTDFKTNGIPTLREGLTRIRSHF